MAINIMETIIKIIIKYESRKLIKLSGISIFTTFDNRIITPNIPNPIVIIAILPFSESYLNKIGNNTDIINIIAINSPIIVDKDSSIFNVPLTLLIIKLNNILIIVNTVVIHIVVIYFDLIILILPCGKEVAYVCQLLYFYLECLLNLV